MTKQLRMRKFQTNYDKILELLKGLVPEGLHRNG